MKILLEAPILSLSGYGEHSRLTFRALKDLPEVEIFVHPLPWGSTSWIGDENPERVEIDECIMRHVVLMNEGKPPHFDVHVHVGIPNEFTKKAAYAVSVTAGIESDRVSDNWVKKVATSIDKVVVPSNHSKQSFLNSFSKSPQALATPIDVVPYPIKTHKAAANNLNLNLTTDFNFLTVALMGPRKNLVNTVKWFVEEFRDDEAVGLVVKTGFGKNSLIDRNRTKDAFSALMESLGEKKCKVYLLHGALSESEMHSLYENEKIKAYLTATHGEGYGLPVFEAAYSGLPVIATNWSGHLDFLTSEESEDLFYPLEYEIKDIPHEAVWGDILVEGSKWAYPTEESFKNGIREVYRKHDTYRERSQILKNILTRSHEQANILTKMSTSILGKERAESLKKIAPEDLPKISIITSVYDGDEYIEGFMEDITSQSIFEEKCELILVNANSPGNEEDTIKKYVDKYPNNIKYFKLDEDPGIYGVWNFAISKSSGEFITNANLDDRKKRNSLEMHASELVKNPKVDLVYSDMLVTEKPNETWENNSSQGKRYNMPEFSFESLKNVNMPHAAPMWRATLHERCGLFEEKYRSAGDWEMWLRAASKGLLFKKIQGCHNLYCFNPKGVSTNPDNFSWKRKEEREIFEKYVNI